jgi:hypothetical protein
MSREILWQICHKNEVNNCEVTRCVVKMLRKQGIKTKQVARDLNIPVERARNWYYKDIGMTALDLLRLMGEYEFVREVVLSSLSHESR